MKGAYKVAIAVFALLGLIYAVTLVSQKAMAQDSKSTAITNEQQEQQEKGEKEENEGNEKEEAEGKETAMTAPQVKITPVQAMKAAEASVGGKAGLAMFEFDEGHWIYGVVVVKDHKLMEVDVDPMTGKAGDHESVTADDESQEFASSLKKLQGMN